MCGIGTGYQREETCSTAANIVKAAMRRPAGKYPMAILHYHETVTFVTWTARHFCDDRRSSDRLEGYYCKFVMGNLKS
jgi:hypothetical protein